MASEENLRADTDARAPLPQGRGTGGRWLIVIVLLLVAAAIAWWFLRQSPAPVVSTEPPAVQPAAVEPAAPVPAPAASVADAGDAAASEVVPPPRAPVDQPALTEAGVPSALAALVGDSALRTLVIGDDFVRRFVVTVDNLPREHAASRLWPVQPTAGRFQAAERDGALLAEAGNSERYTPFVALIEHLDPRAAVALYARMLPLMQREYEELGYPGQRFHDRVIAVIDHLLGAPKAPEPLALHLVEVKGEIPSTRPWVRYEFADPKLQTASAGHKIMLRIGNANQARVKTALRALRAELLRSGQR
ncbi:MAG TPA: DUF3014 domain-containing protein [Rubrivivax sp.]|nr:DUF3014 domain-containing protein [Rubrivivax sp.]